MNEPFSSCLLLLQRARRFIIYTRLTIAINQTKFYNWNFPHLARYFWCGNGAGYYAPPAGNRPH